MKKVLVVFGGRSTEHDVSIITAQFIIGWLKAASVYQPIPLYVNRDGSWYSDPSLANIETFRDPDFPKRLGRLKKVALTVDGGLVLVWPGLKAKRQSIDVVFPAMHGTYGEDGSLMGLLRMANVPFVGCDVAASAIAMDKVLTKQITDQVGVPSVPYLWFHEIDWVHDPTPIRQQIKGLTFPLFIKPAHLGSSIGIARIEKIEQLDQAVEVALHYDDKVIVEQAVTNLIEIHCGIIGNNQPQASILEQPLSRSDFLSFEDKYTAKGGKGKGGSTTGAKGSLMIPAPIDARLTKRIQTLAITAYRAIEASGIARLDFLVDQTTKQPYLNEINPLPGTLQQHLWQASGFSSVELVNKLIDLAEKRFAAGRHKTVAFESSVLSQAGGSKQRT